MAERYRVDKWLVKSTCLENLILESTGPLETRTQFASWLLKDDKSNPEANSLFASNSLPLISRIKSTTLYTIFAFCLV